MTKTPLVSICIPTYNGEKYLKECLDSIVSQTYNNIEIIIVDDKSTDKTIEIINEYLKDKRVHLYKNDINLGLVGNWNKCIEQANGEWIKFVFQDDYITNDCIEKMLLGVKNDINLIACKRTFLLSDKLDEKTNAYYTNEVVTFEKLGIPSTNNFISPETISQMAVGNICLNFIGEPTSIMFKKQITNTLGLFNNQLAQICDLEFCLRVATNYGLTYIPETLTYFRIHDQSTTSTNLSAKTYTLSHIDPIVVVRQLLYDSKYSSFRSNITYKNKVKLNNFFSVRVYEAYKTALLKGSKSEELEKFNLTAQLYPEISSLKNPSLRTAILYQLVILRRKIRQMIK